MAKMREYTLDTLIKTDVDFGMVRTEIETILFNNDASTVSVRDDGIRDMEFPIGDYKQAHYFTYNIRLPRDNVGRLNDDLSLCPYLLKYKLEMKI